MPAFGRFAIVVLLTAAAALHLPAQATASLSPTQPARDLVRDVIYNELHDREGQSHWEYRSECLSSTENLVREQIETDQGPVFRLLERNGNPLDPAQSKREDARLSRYIQSPAQIAHVQREHEEDEARLATIMELLPKAFLFDYDGQAPGGMMQIAFRPDPAFTPSGYEARIVHALDGTLLVDPRQKRMIDMRGVLAERVEFGYGLFGHVEKGGSFEIHRRQVSASHWKTDLVEVHVQGKILMLKTVGKDQREARSNFGAVPSGATLADARNMLIESADPGTRAQLVPTASTPK
jgi:hypothetical protein